MEPNLTLPKKPDYLPPEARRVFIPCIFGFLYWVKLQEKHLQEQLKFMDAKIKERKNMKRLEEKPLKYCIKIEQPLQRPPTPSIQEE
jgi:hypothetical protein